jgi:hypothetical protein
MLQGFLAVLPLGCVPIAEARLSTARSNGRSCVSLAAWRYSRRVGA